MPIGRSPPAQSHLLVQLVRPRSSLGSSACRWPSGAPRASSARSTPARRRRRLPRRDHPAHRRAGRTTPHRPTAEDRRHALDPVAARLIFARPRVPRPRARRARRIWVTAWPPDEHRALGRQYPPGVAMFGPVSTRPPAGSWAGSEQITEVLMSHSNRIAPGTSGRRPSSGSWLRSVHRSPPSPRSPSCARARDDVPDDAGRGAYDRWRQHMGHGREHGPTRRADPTNRFDDWHRRQEP